MLEHLAYPYSVLVVLVVALFFWRPVWGLALFVAIFPMDPWAPRLPVPGMNTETIMIGVGFAATVLRFGGRLPPLRYSGPVLAFIGIMLIGFVVAIPWARSLRGVDGSPAIWFIFKGVKSMTFTALLFFITYWCVRSSEERQRVLVAICIAVFLASLAGIVDFTIGINPRVSDGRANGFLDDANGMAETIGPMLFVQLYVLMRGGAFSRGVRAFAALTYAVGLVAMVLSLSRGNWIGFFAAHAVFLLLVNRKLLVASVATFAVLLSVGFPLLPGIVRDRINVTTEAGPSVYRVPLAVNLEGSAAARVVYAQIGLDMFMGSPIWGLGLNAFHFRTPEFGAKYGALKHMDPHNLVVKLASETGLIGLVVLAWLISAVFRSGRPLWRSDSPEYLLGAVLLAAGTHDLVTNLTTTAFLHVAQISSQFWILFALSSRAYVERFAEQEAPVAASAQAVGWRRFAVRTPVALPQPLTQRARTES